MTVRAASPWTTARLADIAEFVRGVTYRKAEASTEPGLRRVPVLRATNVDAGSLELERHLVYVPESRVGPEQMLATGDIVIATSSGSAAVVGKSAQLHGPWRGSFGAFCGVLRTGQEADSRFVAHYVSSDAVRSQWRAKARGTNINNLKRSDIEQTEVPLPPLDEQRLIVEMIETHLSRLDAGVLSLHRAERQAANLWLSTLSAAMSESDCQPLEFFAATGGITDGPFGSKLKTSHYTDSGPRVLRLQNIGRGVFVDDRSHISEEHFETLAKHQAKAGDLLIASLYGDGLRSCIVPDTVGPAVVKADCIRVRPSDSVDVRFVSYALQRPGIDEWCQERVKGVGRQRLGLAAIKELPIPNMPLADQERIVSRLTTIKSKSDQIRAESVLARRRAATLRRSVLQDAFQGRLTSDRANRDTE